MFLFSGTVVFLAGVIVTQSAARLGRLEAVEPPTSVFRTMADDDEGGVWPWKVYIEPYDSDIAVRLTTSVFADD